MAGTAISVGLKLLETGLKLAGVFGDGGVSQMREDIKNAVKELKGAIEDSKNQIINAVGEAVVQRDYDDCIMRIQKWVDTYQKTVASAIKESGNGKVNRIEPSPAMMAALGQDETGIESTLYKMHGLLNGVQSSKMSLIQLYIKGNFDEPLYSEKVEDQAKGIAWYLKQIRIYLQTQFQAQACGFALLALYQGKTADLDEITKLATDRFTLQDAAAWEVLPPVIKMMKKDWATPISPTKFWRFEKGDNMKHWMAIGEDDLIWHEPNGSGPHTQWRFLSSKTGKPVSLEDEDQVWVVSRSFPTLDRIIKERHPMDLKFGAPNYPDMKWDYLRENMWHVDRSRWWAPVGSIFGPTESSLGYKDSYKIFYKFDQVRVLIKIAPVKNAIKPQFCLVPVASSLTKLKGENENRPRTVICNNGIFNTALVLSDKDIDQTPLMFPNGTMFGGDGPHIGY